MNTTDYTNHPEKYPHKATNKTSNESVAYGVSIENGKKVFQVIAPSSGTIVTYDQLDFEHSFKPAGVPVPRCPKCEAKLHHGWRTCKHCGYKRR